MTKLIMDVDTGGDDAVAMLMAGHAKELELVAVTAVHGNASLQTTLRNTLATLEAGGLADVPVYAGEYAAAEWPAAHQIELAIACGSGQDGEFVAQIRHVPAEFL